MNFHADYLNILGMFILCQRLSEMKGWLVNMGYMQCTRCVMDNTSDDTIVFDVTGVCNYCTNVLERVDKEYFPNEEGKKRLTKMISKIKEECKNDAYDCMVGISGGVDSSYVLYLGYKYGLRMLAVHIDDGYDTEQAKENIEKICKAADTKLINVKPDAEQYDDLIFSFLKAGLPDLALIQDNILLASLYKYAKENKIKYFLSGANFAHECILERNTGSVDACDKRHILAINRKFGRVKVDNLEFISIARKYIGQKYFSKVITLRPLNYVDYNLLKVLNELYEFSGYEYYGGKHYESILTRFMQCYYLPVKFNKDKRKSHFSSLIINGQMKREEAVERLKKSAYINEKVLEADMVFLSQKFDITVDELMRIINDIPPKRHTDYAHSVLNKFSKIARKFRKYLG